MILFGRIKKMISIFDVIGYIGVALYITSYALLATQKITGDSVIYHTLNLIAPSCVLVSLSIEFNAPSAVIQSVWVVISLIALFRIYKLNNTSTKQGIFTNER